MSRNFQLLALSMAVAFLKPSDASAQIYGLDGTSRACIAFNGQDYQRTLHEASAMYRPQQQNDLLVEMLFAGAAYMIPEDRSDGEAALRQISETQHWERVDWSVWRKKIIDACSAYRIRRVSTRGSTTSPAIFGPDTRGSTRPPFGRQLPDAPGTTGTSRPTVGLDRIKVGNKLRE